MGSNIYYMIGRLMGHNKLIGYRIINKLTFEITDVSINDSRLIDTENIEISEILYKDIHGATKVEKVKKDANIKEYNQKYSILGFNCKSNCGAIERYSLIDYDNSRMVYGKHVVFNQDYYFYIVLYTGEILIVTKRELEKFLSLERFTDSFANIKIVPGTSSKNGYIGCIKKPINIYSETFKVSSSLCDYTNAIKCLVLYSQTRRKTLQFLASLNMYLNVSISNIEENIGLLSLEIIPSECVNNYIFKNMDTDYLDANIVNRVICYYSSISIHIGRLYIQKSIDYDNVCKFEIDAYFSGMHNMNGQIAQYDAYCAFRYIVIKKAYNGVCLIGYVGGYGGNPPIEIMLKYIFNGHAFRVTDAVFKKELNIPKTSKNNYQKALRLMGITNVDNLYCIDVKNDAFLTQYIDVLDDIDSLSIDYYNIGNKSNNLKLLDINNNELIEKNLTAERFERILQSLRLTPLIIKSRSSLRFVNVIPLNRYEYVKIHVVSGELGFKRRNVHPIWATSQFDYNYYIIYILSIYSYGKELANYMWYSSSARDNWYSMHDLFHNIFDRVINLSKKNKVTSIKSFSCVSEETMKIINNTGKSFGYISADIFFKYNPFTYDVGKSHFSDKQDEKISKVKAEWDYGVCIIDSSYYVYIRASFDGISQSSGDMTLRGIIKTPNRIRYYEDLAIPVIRFKTYEHMFNFYNKYLSKSKETSTAIAIAEIIIKGELLHETKITFGLAKEIYRNSKNGAGLNKARIEETLCDTIDNCGIILGGN